MAQKKKTDDVVFGRSQGFSKEYPMLADAIFAYEEFDFSGRVKTGVHSLLRDGHVVGCSNSKCRGGGYDLLPHIELMMSLKPRRAKTIRMLCEGWDHKVPAPINRVNSCTGSIEGKLRLKMHGNDNR